MESKLAGETEVNKEQKVKMSENAKKLYLALKAMTAMKLCKTDGKPAEILEGRLYLGSIGVAFNKESLQSNGITHILTAADKIQPRFPSVIISHKTSIGLQV